MIQVVPAIIPKSFDDLVSKLNKVKPFVQTVQMDIMDGVYTPEASWPYNSTNGITDAGLIVHNDLFDGNGITVGLDMMVKNPEDHIEQWMDVGVDRLIIHYESTERMQYIIDRARERNISVGIALLPGTPNSEIERFISKIDFIQCMGNQKIGFHGVELDDKVLDKIKELRIDYPELTIAVDIGVTFETAPKLILAGANRLVSGSTIFNSSDIQNAIQKLSGIVQ